MSTISDGPIHDDRYEDRLQLRAMLQDVTTAINQKEWKILDRWLDPGVVITMIDQVCLQGQESLSHYVESKLGRFSSILADLRVDPVVDTPATFHGDTAVCPLSSADHFIFRNGKEFMVTNRYTAIMVKKDGAWKLVALHAGANAFNNPISYQFQKVLYGAIGGAGVAGLALGILLARKD